MAVLVEGTVSYERSQPCNCVQVVVKPLTDHERLVNFVGRFHASAKTKSLDLEGTYVYIYIYIYIYVYIYIYIYIYVYIDI